VALCLCEKRTSIAAAEMIAAWQREQGDAVGTGIEHVWLGTVIAQQGL
jgi:hypothetical protein